VPVPAGEDGRVAERDWGGYFRTAGWPDPAPLGQGVEGAVYALDDRRVAELLDAGGARYALVGW
jgi:hypothetical protein